MMPEKGKISNGQAVYLIISTILSTASLGFLPTLMYKEAGRDSWMSVLLAIGFGVAAGSVITSLGMRFPDKTIVQYAGQVAGRVPGKIIGLLYAVFFLHINSFIIRTFGEVFITYFMPETPLLVFIIGIVLASAYAARCGLEVVARVNEVILPVALGLGLLIFCLSIPNMQINNFTPLLEKGIPPVLKGTYPALVFFTETIVMAMFIPYLNRPRQAGKVIFQGFTVIGLFQMLTTIATTGVLGARVARAQFPVMIQARQISIAEIIERVEPLIMLMWMIAAFVKVVVFYYCVVLATAQWLNLKEYQALVLPTGALLTALSVILWANVLDLTEQIAGVIPPYFLFIEVGLPLILLVTAILRGKGEGGR